MVNGYTPSSPVRAITSIDHTGHDPLRRAIAGDLAPAPSRRPAAPDAVHALSCPVCGTPLRLQLQPVPHGPPVASESDGHRPRPTYEPEPEPEPEQEPLPDFESTVKDYKRRLVGRALEENGGVMTRAAKALGVKYTTFVAMAHRLGVVEKDGNDNHDRQR